MMIYHDALLCPAITDPPGFVFPSSDMLKITANG